MDDCDDGGETVMLEFLRKNVAAKKNNSSSKGKSKNKRIKKGDNDDQSLLNCDNNDGNIKVSGESSDGGGEGGDKDKDKDIGGEELVDRRYGVTNGCNVDDVVIAAVKPRRGRLLVFPHVTPHAGLPVLRLPK
eukprot:Pgem_evm1s14483